MEEDPTAQLPVFADHRPAASRHHLRLVVAVHETPTRLPSKRQSISPNTQMNSKVSLIESNMRLGVLVEQLRLPLVGLEHLLSAAETLRCFHGVTGIRYFR